MAYMQLHDLHVEHDNIQHVSHASLACGVAWEMHDLCATAA